MADLFKSQYEIGSLRRGVQDGDDLWNLLAEDGTITIVDDPTPEEVTAAQTKLAEAAQAEGEEAAADAEEQAKAEAEKAALERVASFPVAPEAEEEDEEPAPEEPEPEAKAETKAKVTGR